MKIKFKFLTLIILFLAIFTSISFAETITVDKDYLGESYDILLPDIDLSNGYMYIYTSGWGYELKVLDSGSYFWHDGDVRIYIQGTGKSYKYVNGGWSSASNLSSGSDTRINNALRLYFSTDIYSDKDKTGYFYKVSDSDIVEEVPTYPKYDFSANGVLSWVWQQIEDLKGISRDEIVRSEEFIEMWEQYQIEQNTKNETLLDKIGHILDYINPASDKFFLKSVLDLLLNLIDVIVGFIDGLFNFLWNLIVNVFEFLFVPNQERFVAIGETVSSKFGFVDVIKNSVNSLKNSFNNIENSPSLSIDVNSRYYTGSLVSINMSWYAQFKPFVDTVITGFCYLFFLWRLFVGVPNIINGVGTGITYIDKLRGVDKE